MAPVEHVHTTEWLRVWDRSSEQCGMERVTVCSGALDSSGWFGIAGSSHAELSVASQVGQCGPLDQSCTRHVYLLCIFTALAVSALCGTSIALRYRNRCPFSVLVRGHHCIELIERQ